LIFPYDLFTPPFLFAVCGIIPLFLLCYLGTITPLPRFLFAGLRQKPYPSTLFRPSSGPLPFCCTYRARELAVNIYFPKFMPIFSSPALTAPEFPNSNTRSSVLFLLNLPMRHSPPFDPHRSTVICLHWRDRCCQISPARLISRAGALVPGD